MSYQILQGDVLERLRELPESSVHCVVTSPPYWGLRDYGVAGQIGLEPTPEEFTARLVDVFREVRRVLRADGTCWLNMGDCYAGSGRGGNTSDTSGLEGTTESQEQSRKARGSTKPTVLHKATIENGVIGRAWTPAPRGLKQKDLIGQPWMLAFALRADGWYLRQEIIWAKPNPMPESVTDRCTKAHEYIFLLSKSARYFYDAEAIKERAVWSVPETSDTGVGFGRGYDAVTKPRAKGSSTSSFRGQGAHRANEIDRACRDGREMHEVGRVAMRNKRSVWEIATEPFPEAHFATFPTELVKPCLLAGTSEKGCCARCGAPWARIVTVDYENPGNRTSNGSRSLENRTITAGFAQRLEKHTETTGWRKACECLGDDAPVPCTVLDPFSGAGTTGLVAVRLGRQYLGIELNPEYVAMSERRLRDDRPLFAPPIAVVPVAEQISFDGVGH